MCHTVTTIRREFKEHLYEDAEGTEAIRAGQVGLMYTTATLMMKAMQLQDDVAAGIDIQVTSRLPETNSPLTVCHIHAVWQQTG